MRSLQIDHECPPAVSIQRHPGKLHCSNWQNAFKLQAQLVECRGQPRVKRDHQCRVPRSIFILRLAEFAGPIAGLQRLVYNLSEVALTHGRKPVTALISSRTYKLAGKQRIEYSIHL